MKVLVLGSGGREHALAWKLARSPSVSSVYALPGNPGTEQCARSIPAAHNDAQSWLDAATRHAIDLTVVGPEAPLVAGVVDAFRAAGKLIVGPTQSQARLEGSKVYAKSFFQKHGIPTAAFVNVSNAAEAKTALDRSRFPIVIKADGLAAGKGVVIASNRAEADEAVAALGPALVIEEFLAGEEVSFIVLSDGREIRELEPCQDHKTLHDDDRGPNTGGMGAYCDSRILTRAQRDQVLETIIRPTIDATGFTGFLYAGIMMTADGPKLLEFNVRLGDPETQPILYRLKSDWAAVLMAAATGRLADAPALEWNPDPAVCVVLAAPGYPHRPVTGSRIHGVAKAEAAGTTVFVAGAKLASQGLETAGGRVLGVTASGPDLQSACDATYAGVECIKFEGMQYRRDIGRKGLFRWEAPRYNTDTGT